MPHVTHAMENVCVAQQLILTLPLNIGTLHLPQMFLKMSLDGVPSFLIDSNVSEAKTTKE
jgi:hypothetical protein